MKNGLQGWRIPFILFGVLIIYVYGGGGILSIWFDSDTAGDILLGIAGIVGIIIAIVIFYTLVFSFPGMGGKMCPECCRYIHKGERKCNYCHEKQLSKKNYEDRKREEKREQAQVYEKIQKAFGYDENNLINKKS